MTSKIQIHLGEPLDGTDYLSSRFGRPNRVVAGFVSADGSQAVALVQFTGPPTMMFMLDYYVMLLGSTGLPLRDTHGYSSLQHALGSMQEMADYMHREDAQCGA